MEVKKFEREGFFFFLTVVAPVCVYFVLVELVVLLFAVVIFFPAFGSRILRVISFLSFCLCVYVCVSHLAQLNALVSCRLDRKNS